MQSEGKRNLSYDKLLQTRPAGLEPATCGLEVCKDDAPTIEFQRSCNNSPNDLALLQRQSPELANVIERLTILRGSTLIDLADIEAVLGPPQPDLHAASSHGGLTDALSTFETSLIQSALHRAGGNVADAARMLKTDRANLYRRMRRLRINPTLGRVEKTLN